ncbi:hypothetical protein QWJ26_25395 [Streptomyces sp. CSDS2]|uniref:DedA family protein n=1 Tax=Streptomyces sp. CSDS2 TaxID=3055051 RepID=UPI0025B24351|nr:hypothetical protein [Streptomyces sp. CSDS2]MDN3263086.1 hypothetical protein [Streptomyces sp. CSDS2]
MSSPPLPGPLALLEPLPGHYGYGAVGAVVFVEDFGVPAPGETILLAAGVYAGAGRLDVVAVALIAFAAAVAGDNAGYLIGRAGGRAFVHRWGRYAFLTPKRFEAAEGFFTRHRDLRRDQALPAVRRPRRRRDRGVRRAPPPAAAPRPLIRHRVWTPAQRQSGGGPQTASYVGK